MLRSTNHLAREGLRSWTTTTTPLCSRRVAWLPRARNSRIMSQPQIHFSIARSSMAAAHHGQYRASAYVPGDVHGGYLKGPRSWTKGSALGNVGPLMWVHYVLNRKLFLFSTAHDSWICTYYLKFIPKFENFDFFSQKLVRWKCCYSTVPRAAIAVRCL